ncbi:MAG: TAXI family TRAP transporter solute-binding subunit [Pseudomonadota bacterium]
MVGKGLGRRICKIGSLAAVMLALIPVGTFLRAQDFFYFAIATGGIGGTYYPLAGVIANAISSPPGSRPCDQGGSCGVAGLIAVAQTSNGSVQNVQSVSDRVVTSAFSQSDVAYWAFSATGTFEGQEPLTDLRAIAALYPEQVHLVASVESGIETVYDLAGKRVSIDTEDSGTNVDSRLILEAFGINEGDLELSFLQPTAAADALRAGDLDAFFVVAGYPIVAVEELAQEHDVRMVPITGEQIDTMMDEFAFFAGDTIPGGIYDGNLEIVETLAVGAQWVTHAEEDARLVYEVTQALWNDATRQLLDVGHPKGASVTLGTALDGVAIPLHPGAERYYREQGLIK